MSPPAVSSLKFWCMGVAGAGPLDFALAYAAAGWRVLPTHTIRDGRCSCGKPECGSPGKHPVARHVPRGCLDATTDAELLRAWWAAMPDANPSIATGAASGLVVMDVDVKGGRRGDRALVDLVLRHGPIGNVPSVITGSGTQHFYFAHPGGLVPNAQNRPAEGIDVRGDGGYVLAPPSLHASGGLYQWVRP